MITCTRRLQWCMGHRVYQHESKCGHLHGHNYVGFFTAVAPDLDLQGRVIDFSVLKEKIMGWIDTNWDHGMVMWREDPALPLVSQTPDVPGGKQRVYPLPYNPTGENLAKYLGLRICPTLFAGTNVEIVKVVLYETENGIAEWTSDKLSRPCMMIPDCDFHPHDYPGDHA